MRHLILAFCILAPILAPTLAVAAPAAPDRIEIPGFPLGTPCEESCYADTWIDCLDYLRSEWKRCPTFLPAQFCEILALRELHNVCVESAAECVESCGE